jgi:hypothetical protein
MFSKLPKAEFIAVARSPDGSPPPLGERIAKKRLWL